MGDMDGQVLTPGRFRACWKVEDYRKHVTHSGRARAVDEAQEAAEKVVQEIGRGLTAVRATVWVEGEPGGWNMRPGGVGEENKHKRRRRRGFSWLRWEPEL